MTSRAAALALAAPLFLAAPALAKPTLGLSGVHHDGDKSLSIGVTLGDHRPHISLQAVEHRSHYRGDRYHYGDRYHHGDRYQYGDRYHHGDRHARRTAVRACRQAIRQEARYIGFRDIDFDDGRHVRQIGPRGYLVRFHEVEFEGRKREFERAITCEVRRGDRVVSLEGIPRPGHRGRGYGRHGHRGW